MPSGWACRTASGSVDRCVIDRLGSAVRAHALRIVVAHVCDHIPPGVRGELSGEGANAAARTHDQHRLAGERLEQVHQGEPGATRRRQRRRDNVIESSWELVPAAHPR